MKIVSREEFLKLPPHTLYSKFHPHTGFGEMQIKLDTMFKAEPTDEEATPYDWGLLELSDAAEMQLRDAGDVSLEEAILDGKDRPLDFTICDQDGFYNREQLFGIYSNEDIDGLIVELQKCLKE